MGTGSLTICDSVKKQIKKYMFFQLKNTQYNMMDVPHNVYISMCGQSRL